MVNSRVSPLKQPFGFAHYLGQKFWEILLSKICRGGYTSTSMLEHVRFACVVCFMPLGLG